MGEGCQRPLVPPSPALPGAPGLASLGDSYVEMEAGSLPHLADEETDSAAVSALLRGTGQVCAERGWTGQNPSMEDAAAMLVPRSMGPWTDSWSGNRTPGS